MKRMSKGPVRRIRLRAVVAYPAVTAALVAVVALALTPFGPSQVVALAAIPDLSATATADPTASATPTADPTASATPTADPTASATTVPGTVASPSPGLGVSPGAPFSDHHVIARIAGPALPASYLPIDAVVPDASQFQTFRVRFRLHNAGTTPITATPQLEFSLAAASSYTLVPMTPQLGTPFHIAREWVPSGGGAVQGPTADDIAADSFLMAPEAGLAMTGHHSMGANPDQSVTLPIDSYTEEEFTIATSMDAKYLTGYELRITDGGTPLTTDVASINLGASPEVQLSPGQREGVVVVDPTPAGAAGLAYPLTSAPLTAAGASSATVVPGVYSPSAAAYPLAAATISTATAAEPGAVLISESGIKGSHSAMADQCGICHRGHTAKAPNLLAASSQSELCFACHNGSAASSNVQAQYSLPLRANDAATREYYSHDAVNSEPTTAHTRSELDEFGGLSNRHSECADCHNSHKVGSADSTQTVTGWDASGRLAGVSGVSVDNSPTADAAPTYAFLDGVTNPVTREYQLCFKCHSGFTTLASNATLASSTPPQLSKYALDKGIEFNPNNASFHPVEAAGTNGTDAMKASLAGSSPNKLWNFNVGSTIRCLNCHAGGSTPDVTSTPPPAVGGSLPPHASSNRGILLQNYQDRELKPRVDVVTVKGVVVNKAAYNAGDFALCYVCHAEKPFANAASPASTTATNFSFHGLHLTGLVGKGDAGTSIDKAGDGQGNAICAECHFRIHSTTYKVGAQAIDGSRLVNFAPDVQSVVPDGAVSWTPQSAATSGSCTLTCHGYSHNALKY